jgi:hypothetical protein
MAIERARPDQKWPKIGTPNSNGAVSEFVQNDASTAICQKFRTLRSEKSIVSRMYYPVRGRKFLRGKYQIPYTYIQQPYFIERSDSFSG